MGLPPTLEEVQKTHSVDSVQTDDKLKDYLRDLMKKNTRLFSLPGTPSPIQVDIENSDILRDAIGEARLTKDAEEIALMRQANVISSNAHEQVMRAVGRGEVKSEFQAQALFEFECKFKASKSLAYEVIAAYGRSSSTLHYIVNDQDFDMNKGNLILIDGKRLDATERCQSRDLSAVLKAGCEVKNYGADITRTFPVGNGGRFTKEGRQIYDIVLKMQDVRLPCQTAQLSSYLLADRSCRNEAGRIMGTDSLADARGMRCFHRINHYPLV